MLPGLKRASKMPLGLVNFKVGRGHEKKYPRRTIKVSMQLPTYPGTWAWWLLTPAEARKLAAKLKKIAEETND